MTRIALFAAVSLSLGGHPRRLHELRPAGPCRGPVFRERCGSRRRCCPGELAASVSESMARPPIPSFNYDVEGGSLAASLPSTPPPRTSPKAPSSSPAKPKAPPPDRPLRERSPGDGNRRASPDGQVAVNVSLDAGPDAAARTGVTNPHCLGAGSCTLVANTSGDSPESSSLPQQLPFGFYTVRQVLGSDTRTACSAGAFLQSRCSRLR